MTSRLSLVLFLSALAGAQVPGPPAAYRLGLGDEVLVRVLDLTDELGANPFRVDQDGKISLPLVGAAQAGGRTVEELRADLVTRFKKFLLDPQVTVAVSAYHSQPVSVLGAVKTPGVFQVETGKTLYQVLSLAGGLDINAGSVIRITRQKAYGPIPLPGAELDPSGEFMVAQVSVGAVIGAQDPTLNITVRPYDVITVPKASTVYVVGSVKTPGGFGLGNSDSLSVLRAVALAQGLDKTASPKKARILRGVEGTTAKMELPVYVKAILAGKSPDVPLGPGDVLFIPSAHDLKTGAWKAADIAARIGEVMLWRY
ncbi:MAG: polysaccharide export protein [Acidobacteriia bacterium]|nr:polysaccharide export protein [Terriglobia bacterium]